MYYNNNNGIMKYQNQINIIVTFRKLWEQHIMWTRSFIISTAAGLEDLEYVTERLLRNPSDFANVLRNYYGQEKAKHFEKLLKEHLLIAADLVHSIKDNHLDEIMDIRKKWYKNADEISVLLSEMNPYWPVRKFRSLFYGHLKKTEDEAVFRINSKYPLDIMIYDSIQAEAMKMADFMSYGIINQFYTNS